jgi:cell division protein FtsB
MQLWLALLPCALSALGLIASVGLFAGMTRRVRKNGKQVAACEAALQSEAAQLTNAINELKRRIADLESAELRNTADPQPVSDLSGAARGRVFKLHRAGQASSDIAHKLRLSKGEVELLIKAQRIVMRPYQDELTAAGGGGEKG